MISYKVTVGKILYDKQINTDNFVQLINFFMTPYRI